jgi:hypothetical protein
MHNGAYVQTNGDVLNIRYTPNGQVVESLPNGSFVEVFGDTVSAAGFNWVQIALNRWVASEYLVYALYIAYVKTNGDVLNVRSTPNGQVVDSLPNGKQVYVFSQPIAAGGFSWVEIGLNRYVASEFLD